MDPAVETFDKICRTCLSESVNMKSLFTKLEGQDRKLSDLFTFTANITVELEDKLPKQVCGECEYNIQKADEFKRRCLESQTVLQKVANSQNFELPNLKQDENKTFLDNLTNFEVKAIDNKVFNELSDSLNDTLESETTVKEELTIEYDDNDFNTQADDFETYTETKSEVKRHKCVCNEEFDTKTLLKTHLKGSNCKSKKKKQEKYVGFKIKSEFTCTKCDLIFTSVTEYREHKNTHRLEINSENSENKNKLDLNNDIPEFECSNCLRRFKTKKTLSKHLKWHETVANIKYTCTKCKRDFKYAAHLNTHMLTVHKQNEFNCGQCKETFNNKEEYLIHKDTHAKKKHTCNMCNKSFSMLCTLKDHIRSHTGEKPFLCATCGKGFSQKTNLVQHTRRHMGLKPFKCVLCPKGFVSKGELEAHNRKHSGAHPFVCDDCGNGFTTSSALVKHRRVHTGERPYHCDLCTMKFATSGTLANHRRTHTGERPYQCSYCEKAFAQRTDLVTHIRCHTGERPYVCTQCGQSFRKTATLKAHLKIHSKEVILGKEMIHGKEIMLGKEMMHDKEMMQGLVIGVCDSQINS